MPKKFSWIVFSIFLCLGICVANYLRIYFVFLYLTTLIILILSFLLLRREVFIIFIYILAFFLGILVSLNQKTLPLNHLKNLKIPLPSKVKVKGIILDYPKVYNEYTDFIFGLQEIINRKNSYPINGKILVRVFKKDNFFYSDNLILEGKLYLPYYRSYRNYLKQKSIYGILKVGRNDQIIHLEKTKINFLKLWIFKLREKIKELFRNNLSTFSYSILSAVILGERSNISFPVWDIFLKVGTVHILAISGLHIAIVGFIFLLILKILRIPRTLRFLLVIFILIVYCILTESSSSVLRATLMGVILLGAKIFKRDTDIKDSLFLSGIFILIFWPLQIFSISFQLSFLSVLSIVLIFPLIKSSLPLFLYKNGLTRFFILNFCVSVSSFLGIFPLVAYYFKIIPLVSILANIVIVPYMGILVASSFALIFSKILFPFLFSYIAKSCDLLTQGLFKLNSLFLKVPFAYYKLSGFPFLWLFLCYTFLILIIFLFYHFLNKRPAI